MLTLFQTPKLDAHTLLNGIDKEAALRTLRRAPADMVARAMRFYNENYEARSPLNLNDRDCILGHLLNMGVGEPAPTPR